MTLRCLYLRSFWLYLALCLPHFVAPTILMANIQPLLKPVTGALTVPKGGTFRIAMDSEPPTLHPLLSLNASAAFIRSYLCDSLLARHPQTGAWKGALAESWSVSKDGMEFIFKLRPGLVFHDGVALQAGDVKFTFDAVNDSQYGKLVGHLKSYFEGIKRVEVIDPLTVKFTTRQKYFKNFFVVASFPIIPSHIYSHFEKSRGLNHELICSGAYKLDQFMMGQKIVISKFDGWYGFKIPDFANYYNFQSIEFCLYRNDFARFHSLVKQEVDFVGLSIDDYVRKTAASEFGKTVFEVKAENNLNPGFSFIAWNLKHPLFQSRNIRLALSYLLDRESMNQMFRMGLSDLPHAPIPAHIPSYPPTVKPLLFNPEKAHQLLAKEGWSDTDEDGVLDRIENGRKIRFEFDFYYPEPQYEKFWSFYQQSLRRAGIIVHLQSRDWGTFLNILQERKFAAVGLSRLFFDDEPDPKEMWHSASAGKGGANITGYENKEVDALIDRARVTEQVATRRTLMQTIYARIAEDVPMTPLFSDRYSYFAVSSRIQRPLQTAKHDFDFRFWWARVKK